MTVTRLKSDERTIEHEIWSKWIGHVDDVALRFFDEMEDDPFAYNETASVSVLAAGAALSGMIGLSDYRATKGSKLDRRKNSHGRCDLFLYSSKRSWAFEFKQVHVASLTIGQLERAGDSAVAEAHRNRAREADSRAAGLIVSTYWADAGAAREKAAQIAEGYASQWHFAWRIANPHTDQGNTYLYFEII